jgi:hypothetical protein
MTCLLLELVPPNRIFLPVEKHIFISVNIRAPGWDPAALLGWTEFRKAQRWRGPALAFSNPQSWPSFRWNTGTPGDPWFLVHTLAGLLYVGNFLSHMVLPSFSTEERTRGGARPEGEKKSDATSRILHYRVRVCRSIHPALFRFSTTVCVFYRHVWWMLGVWWGNYSFHHDLLHMLSKPLFGQIFSSLHQMLV